MIETKAVFIYTNGNSPQVDVYPNTTKIEEATVDSVEKVNIYHSVGDPPVVTIEAKNKADGQVAIFWS